MNLFKKMQFTFLGTGTSQGVPVIGCDCPVCLSENPKDKRLRVSGMLEIDGIKIVIDCGPDFRQQMLREKVVEIEALLITHEHNDHIIGLDDVRPINFRQGRNMSIYALERVQKDLMERFSYVFAANKYPGAPMVELKTISKENAFEVAGIEIIPIEVWHGKLPILGFRVKDFTYLTDVRTIEKEEIEKIKGTKILVLSALHHTEHHSHLNLQQALELIEEIQPKQTYLIHLSHNMGLYEDIMKLLPPNVFMGYDGLKIDIH